MTIQSNHTLYKFFVIKLASRVIISSWLSILLGKKYSKILITNSHKQNIIIRRYTADIPEAAIIFSDYEYPLAQISKQIPTGLCVIDVGAHIGLFSLHALRFLDISELHCFEPFCENYRILKANLDLNQNNSQTIRTNMVAIDKECGQAFIEKTHDFDSVKLTTTATALVVRKTTLKDYCKINDIHRINLLKVDIEGLEWDWIPGEIDYLKNHVERIFVEVHGGTPEKLSEVFGCDFTLHRISWRIAYLENNHLLPST